MWEATGSYFVQIVFVVWWVHLFSGSQSNDLNDECCFSFQGSHFKRDTDPWNCSRGKGARMIKLPSAEQGTDWKKGQTNRLSTGLTPSRRVGVPRASKEQKQDHSRKEGNVFCSELTPNRPGLPVPLSPSQRATCPQHWAFHLLCAFN